MSGRNIILEQRSGSVVSSPYDTVARAGNGHFGKLEHRVVSRGKLAVGREGHNPCVLEVPRHNGQEAVKLSSACGMRLDAVVCQ